jgi:hypothetical protein
MMEICTREQVRCRRYSGTLGEDYSEKGSVGPTLTYPQHIHPDRSGNIDNPLLRATDMLMSGLYDHGA